MNCSTKMKTHFQSRIFCGLILSHLALTVFSYEPNILQDLRETTSRLLFGQVWKYGEYCGDLRTSDELVQEDVEAAMFYEKSDSLLYPNQTVDADLLIYQGIRARYFTSLTCAINSWGYKDEETFVESESPENDERQCLSSIDNLYSSIVNKSSLKVDGRSWHQLNSFGKVPQGSIQHTHQWLGDYSECIIDRDSRYCFAGYRMNMWPNNTESTRISIRIGLCLPKSCNENLYRKDDYLAKLDEIVKSNLNQGMIDFRVYHLVGMYCPPSLDSKYMKLFKDFTSILLGVLAGIWITTLVYATVLGYKMDLQKLEYFNLRWVCSKFLSPQKSDPQLSGLNFFKVICFFWILCSHYIMLVMSYVFNIQDIRRIWNSSLFGTFIFQGQHAVPLFFIVSGLLVGHKYIGQDREPTRYKSFVWQRYLRLAPLYLVVYSYVKKFAHLLDSGPLWDYGVSPQSEVNQCHQESWLVPLLMLANFLHPFSHCILTGWHIANDFQIFLILPFYIWIYRRSRRLGNWIAAISFLLTHLFHFYNFHSSYNYSFDLLVKESYLFGSRYIMDRLVIDYVNPLGRFGTIIIGLYLASLLKSDKFCSRYSTPKFRAISILVGLIIVLMSVMARFEIVLGELMFGPYLRSVAYPFTRLTVEVGWFLILMGTLISNHRTLELTGGSILQNGRCYDGLEMVSGMSKVGVKKSIGFHKWPVWDVLVKLNYSLMLIHFAVFKHLVQSNQSQPIHFSMLSFIQNGSFVILMSYLASLLLHMVVEVPLTSLIKHLTKR